MISIGTPNSVVATRVMLLGSGELGKEVAIELQRLGVEVIAVDRYAGAPAMQVAHRSHVLSMLDGDALKAVIQEEQPHFIVPEIEAIATSVLLELEEQGQKVVPSARAAHLTMNREGIRRLAAEDLGLPVSAYTFADDLSELQAAAAQIGFPCLVKPIMSSSGKGQSKVDSAAGLEAAWLRAQQEGRAGGGRVIVEAFVPFDYEITLLTIQHSAGVTFCAPIGHQQVDGDYRFSWQPQSMTPALLAESRRIAAMVTQALGGFGLFGVELFIRGSEVLFSEVSPRPHDTGLVTLYSQNQSEFALHARALLGLPIHEPILLTPAASAAVLVQGHSDRLCFDALDAVLSEPGVDLRLFGKPQVAGQRRMGVILASGDSAADATSRAGEALSRLRWRL